MSNERLRGIEERLAAGTGVESWVPYLLRVARAAERLAWLTGIVACQSEKDSDCDDTPCAVCELRRALEGTPEPEKEGT